MKRTLIFLVAALMLTSMVAFAQQGQGFRSGPDGGCRGMNKGAGMHGKGGAGGGAHKILKFSDELGLEDNQIAKIKQMAEEFALESVDRHADVKKANIQLHSLKANDGSENEVMSMIDKVTDLEANLDKMMYKHHQAIKSILTDEQLDKLESLRKERGDNKRPNCDGKRKFDSSGNGR